MREYDEAPEVTRCRFCFQPVTTKKRERTVRKVSIEGVEHYAYVCDDRCGELWQESVRRDYERMMAYLMTVAV